MESKIVLLCINDKGVFNIKEGKKYESNGSIIYNECVRSICICITNDMGELSHYNMDRFKII